MKLGPPQQVVCTKAMALKQIATSTRDLSSGTTQRKRRNKEENSNGARRKACAGRTDQTTAVHLIYTGIFLGPFIVGCTPRLEVPLFSQKTFSECRGSLTPSLWKPFLGTNLLEDSIGRGFRAKRVLINPKSTGISPSWLKSIFVKYLGHGIVYRAALVFPPKSDFALEGYYRVYHTSSEEPQKRK